MSGSGSMPPSSALAANTQVPAASAAARTRPMPDGVSSHMSAQLPELPELLRELGEKALRDSLWLSLFHAQQLRRFDIETTLHAILAAVVRQQQTSSERNDTMSTVASAH